MRHCAPVLLFALAICAATGAEPADEAKDVAVIRAEMERLSPATPIVVTMSYREFENGLIGTARVQLADVLVPGAGGGGESMVIKRFATFDQWKQAKDNRGWNIGRSADSSIHCTVYRRFAIGNAAVDLQLADELSYGRAARIVAFFVAQTGLKNVYTIRSEAGVVTIRTLDEYIDGLNARGLVFEVESDPAGAPVKVTAKGRWIS